MFRKKGAKTLEEWENALSGVLTDGKREYILRGKPKRIGYSTLLKLIDGCVIDNLNLSLALFKEGCDDLTESLFRLTRLEDTLRKISFYAELDFIKDADKRKIASRASGAVNGFLEQTEDLGDNPHPDVVYHLAEIKRLSESGFRRPKKVRPKKRGKRENSREEK